ncbi:hypothetical protein [Myroides indicus]|uniref:Uncharacterized protein n=1 Tax=Myroides indicus TaxID=1323422 RepID=A0A4R7FCW1_9FLAO|nr:hypothetical protein [Myroides indicus]TDS65093.1 hypothetical protein C8P70_103115 [Myroides indicus]
MKIIILTFFALMISGTMQSQNIEKFINVHDSPNEHFGTKDIPTYILQKMLGHYKYDSSNGEPYVKLNKGNKGFFQMHGTPVYPIEYWMEVNEQGEPLMRKGEDNPNFQIVLILKYGANSESEGGFWNGKYSRIPIAFDMINKKANIFSERYKDF